MIKERIICNAKTGEVRREVFEDHAPETVDYISEIEACKHRLAETDYVVIKIAEGAATREEYATVLAERQEIRARMFSAECAMQGQNGSSGQ